MLTRHLMAAVLALLTSTADSVRANSEVPPDLAKEVRQLVQREKYAEAVARVDALLKDKPADPDLQALRSQIVASAKDAGKPIAAAATTSAAPPLSSEDRLQLATLQSILDDHKVSTEPAAKRKLIDEFLRESAPLARRHPELKDLWVQRGLAALELERADDGVEAARRLRDLRVVDSGDDASLTILGRLKRKGWDGEPQRTGEPVPRAGAAGLAPRAGSNQPVVTVKVLDNKGVLVGPLETPKVVKTNAQWQLQLTPEQYRLTRTGGTGRPFQGKLLENLGKGIYSCVCCDLPLFSSDAKFDSGTGWPSFSSAIAKENVSEHEDRSHGMIRTALRCARCDAHLGHKFDDGPPPKGVRFAVNSESLTFTESTQLPSHADPAAR